jgi:hypothetical protein
MLSGLLSWDRRTYWGKERSGEEGRKGEIGGFELLLYKLNVAVLSKYTHL